MSRRKEVGNNRLPKSWKTFLWCDKSKTEHFGFLADWILNIDTDAVVVWTKQEYVVCKKVTYIDQITPCNHEEADMSTFLGIHAKHALQFGIKSFNMVISDTDVVVID